MGEQSTPCAKFHVYRGSVSPLWGEKPILGPLSKNNTGMAALHAGLPVIVNFGKHTYQHNFAVSFSPSALTRGSFAI